jgi:hypothetical protein
MNYPEYFACLPNPPAVGQNAGHFLVKLNVFQGLIEMGVKELQHSPKNDFSTHSDSHIAI